MAEQSTGDFWDGLGDRVFRWLDWEIDDAMGMHQFVGPPYYPEAAAPTPVQPKEPGFEFGNNAGTWAAGLALVAVVALVAYSAKS